MSKNRKHPDRKGKPEKFKDKRSKSRKLAEEGEHREKGPKYSRKRKPEAKKGEELMRLNKYIAHAGVCSRREADDLIASGVIKINGQVVTELGTKVAPSDEVKMGDQKLSSEKPVYLLLNKPKDYLTTVEDDRGRKTVMELVRKACRERVYPVGRLDRTTTGLLLLTNDGELAKKLTHPKHEVKKVYQIETDQNVKKADLDSLVKGVELEDGKVQADAASYVGEAKNIIGLELHSGKNRVVRRMFEALGYKVRKLDRVSFGGLTKKDLPRGKWRHLTQKEINMLKMLPKS